MKARNKWIIFTLVFISVIQLSNAQQRIEKIVNKGVLTVGVSGDQPPFSMVNRKGEFIGYDIELAQLLGASMRVKVEFAKMNFDELLPALKNNEVDIVISGMTITPKRNMSHAFVGPYLISGKSILTKSKTLINATSPNDINMDIKVVTLKGSTSEEFVEEYLPEVEVILEENLDMAINKVRNDEAELLIADYPTCAYAALLFPDEDFAILDQPLTIEPLGIALPNDDFLFINLVDNLLESLEMHGILALMEEKWFENPMWLMQTK